MHTRMLIMLTGALAGVAAITAGHAQAVYDLNKHRVARETIAGPALTAALGNTRALALVNADGSIARSKGIVSVQHVATGEYCVFLKTAIAAATAVPVLSFNYNSSPDYDVFVAYSPNLCGTSNAIGVVTYNADSSSPTSHASADEGFTIVVP